jgi:hydroxymethylglutaryl-CoA lyase
MQGIHEFIPTERKIEYINALLKVGFDTIDFGSFVSPAAIPQMRDTAEVLSKLELSTSKSKLLAIVANVKGIEQACAFPEINYLGFPLSVSETFQQRNTNKSVAESFEVLRKGFEICTSKGKELVVYISMGFGNPYGEPFDEKIVVKFAEELFEMGVRIISLSDTIGTASPELTKKLFGELIKTFPEAEFGAHFHSNPLTAREKIEAAYSAGCRRFDGAVKGLGGCPMAKDDLTGNIATETIIAFAQENNLPLGLDLEQFAKCYQLADSIFPVNIAR